MKKFFNRKMTFIIGFILGGLILGGTSYVIATSIASSSVTYTSNNQSTVEGALNDLYTKADILNQYKSIYSGYVYWTDNYSSIKYESTSVPSMIYPSYTSLVAESETKTFIRSTIANGSPTKHEACLYYNGNLFCNGIGFWSSNGSSGTSVKDALKTAMENALNTTASRCEASLSNARCWFDSGWCGATNGNGFECGSGNNTGWCEVWSTGKEFCH